MPCENPTQRSSLSDAAERRSLYVVSRVNGKLQSDGRANLQRLQQLLTQGPAGAPPAAPPAPSAPSGPPQVPTGPIVQPLAGDAAQRSSLVRDWASATARDGSQVPTIPTAPPAPSVADNYRDGSGFNTLQATRDYTAGKISAADLAHVQTAAQHVGDSPDPVTPATQQPLGRQYGSARILPTSPSAPPTIPSANDPQHTVATKLNVAGGTVTIPAYDGAAPVGSGNRAVEAKNGHIVVACLDGEFTVKKLRRHGRRVWLEPANRAFARIEVGEERDFQVWGVVTSKVTQFKV